MLKLFRGVLEKILSKPVTEGQVLLATDRSQLFFDTNGVRYPVKDPTAGKELDYSNKVIYLKDQNGNTISSITIDPTLTVSFNVNMDDGHLYWE